MSFEDIYKHYSEAVFQYIYFLVGHQTLAEDLMQETFIKAYRSMTQFKGQATYQLRLGVIVSGFFRARSKSSSSKSVTSAGGFYLSSVSICTPIELRKNRNYSSLH
ncbi:RNA polymerase sigma factor [Metasolibacillus meyeri]|uniref:RNA polymerase sigma factor n=1 Tax=Metasolibacillus meyeri TaxID=1071052 RepID=UPI00187D5F11|nr:sigma factor [Metasolibacillus meyeri]